MLQMPRLIMENSKHEQKEGEKEKRGRIFIKHYQIL